MKKFTFIVLVTLCSISSVFSQANLLVKAPAGNNATSTTRAPNGTVAHTTMRGCFFVSQAEIGQYFVPGTNISTFGFSLTAGVTGTAVTGNFTVYLQNTSDASYLKGTSFTTAIAPMTSVYASTMTIPVSAGTTSINLTLPSAFTYTGGGMYVAYDWACSGPFSAGTATYVCDNSIASSGASNATNTTTPVDAMGISAFRPVFIWGAVNSATNDAQVQGIESLGSVPAIFNTGNVIKAYIKNGSNTTMNNIPVNLNVSGANTFADTQTITTLASGATVAVSFAPFNPQTNGVNTMTVTVPADQLSLNNQKAFTQTVTCNIQGSNPQPGSYPVGVGFATNNGIIAERLITPVTATCIGSKISISGDAGSINNSIYSVLMDFNGNVLASSNTLVIASPMLNTAREFTFATPQVLSAGSIYYIGLAQPGNTVSPYWPLAATNATFIPPNLYVTSIIGGGFVFPLTQNLGFFGLNARFQYSATTAAIANPSVSCSGSPVNLMASGASTYTWSTGSTSATAVISPTTSSTYSVTGTSSIGCRSSATVAVSVIQNPTVTAAISNSVICSGNSTTLTAGGADTYTWNTTATSTLVAVNPTVTSIYSVMGTDTITGCSSTATVGVTIDTPTISISSPGSICNGTIAALYASGANTYTWSTASTGSAIAVTPVVTTSYSVTGTNTTGCVGSQTVQVIVNQYPTVTAVALPSGSICAGNTTTISMNGAANYTVNYSTTAVMNATAVTGYSITDSPTITTSYFVSGTYPNNNCVSTKTVTVTVLSCAGLNEKSNSAIKLNLYPNPTSGVFTAEVDNFAGNLVAEIYNVLGEMIRKQVINSEKNKVDLQGEPGGVYFVQLVENGIPVHTSRIVKQ
ncbi:MAG: T9SS type A sorting domain-containing protein [Bacteroidia bacterium]